MSNYKPTTIADVLKAVASLKADAEAELERLHQRSKNLRFGTSEERYNYLSTHDVQGQLLAIAKIEGYLEARIQIDAIYAPQEAAIR